MPVPETVISQILSSVNIVDFISQYVQLKKTGKNYVGLCPFHSEKTPSFSVSPDKNLFYCFGCGEGGNIFSFLMKYESLTFPEAAKTIARYYNIEIPDENRSRYYSQKENERESILRLNREAAKYFHYIMMKTDSGRLCLDYLKNRDIPETLIKEYYLGFIPDSWDTLTKFFKNKNYSEKLAEKSGLIVPKKTGNGFYDRFRSRLIFPIFDVRGDIIGFGGRIIGDGNPKYLNSPETPVYNKSRSLYGLKQASSHCRKENRVYIVEGYIDVLALSKIGVKNCVASLGTSLTQGHIKVLKGFAEKMVLVFDGDEAGVRAAVRSIDVFANEEVDASVLVLPEGLDPDDFIKKYGSDEFIKAAENAKPAIEFLTETLLENHGQSIEGKIKVVSSLEPLLKKISDPVTRSLYVSRISKMLGIKESAIFERIGSNNRNPVSFENKNVKKTVSKEVSKIEISILSALMDLPELKQDVINSRIVDLIYDEDLKKCIQDVINTEAKDSSFILNSKFQPLVAKAKIEQGTWNIRQARILLKQFQYTRNKKRAQS